MKILKTLTKDIHFLEVLKGSSTTIFLRIAGMLLNYFFIFIISHIYGSKILGIFALSIMILQIFSIIGLLGTDKALMKFVSQYTSSENWEGINIASEKVYKIVIPWTLILSFFLFIFSGYIARAIFHKEYLSTFIKMISFGILPNVLLLIISEKIRGFKEIKDYSLLKIALIPFFASTLLSFSIFVIRSSYIPVTVYLISIYITLFIGYFIWKAVFNNNINNIKLKKIRNFPREVTYKSLFSLSLPMLFTNSMVILIGWTDTIMLGIFRSVTEVGIYRIPLRLAALTSIGLFAVNSILGPKISELWEKGDMESLKKIVKQSTMLIFWISLPVFLLFWIFPKQVLGIFGADFKAGYVALIIITFGQFLNSVVGSVGLILLMTGKQIVLQYVVILGTVVNVVLNYFLIPDFGINGAAFASMVSMTIINIIPFFLVKKYFGFYTFSIKRMFFNE